MINATRPAARFLSGVARSPKLVLYPKELRVLSRTTASVTFLARELCGHGSKTLDRVLCAYACVCVCVCVCTYTYVCALCTYSCVCVSSTSQCAPKEVPLDTRKYTLCAATCFDDAVEEGGEKIHSYPISGSMKVHLGLTRPQKSDPTYPPKTPQMPQNRPPK